MWCQCYKYTGMDSSSQFSDAGTHADGFLDHLNFYGVFDFENSSMELPGLSHSWVKMFETSLDSSMDPLNPYGIIALDEDGSMDSQIPPTNKWLLLKPFLTVT